MPRMSVEDALANLKAREDERRKKYKERERRLKERIKRKTSAESKRSQKKDSRRKILVGSWVLDQLEAGHKVNLANKQELLIELDKFLTRKLDKELFFPEEDTSIKADSDEDPATKQSNNLPFNQAQGWSTGGSIGSSAQVRTDQTPNQNNKQKVSWSVSNDGVGSTSDTSE